jgi:hypothetical protein
MAGMVEAVFGNITIIYKKIKKSLTEWSKLAILSVSYFFYIKTVNGKGAVKIIN